MHSLLSGIAPYSHLGLHYPSTAHLNAEISRRDSNAPLIPVVTNNVYSDVVALSDTTDLRTYVKEGMDDCYSRHTGTAYHTAVRALYRGEDCALVDYFRNYLMGMNPKEKKTTIVYLWTIAMSERAISNDEFLSLIDRSCPCMREAW